MRRIIKHGGITFLIIKMCNNYFLFPGEKLLIFIDNNERKSIPYQYIKENSYEIKEGYRPALDYIKAVDSLIKENKNEN